MNDAWRDATAAQFGAAIDMLENAIIACPESLWGDRSRQPEFWYLAFHSLFWLDLYLSASRDAFTPPAPFGLEELDPAGVLPARVYSRDEMLAYLAHGRAKCAARLGSLSGDETRRRFRAGSVDLPVGELMLYNLRHVQHHAAQLYLILRQVTNTAPRWVSRAAGDPAPPLRRSRGAGSP